MVLREGDDVRPHAERLRPVVVLILRPVAANERVDERDPHHLGSGDDVLEVADDLLAMLQIRVKRVWVEAEPGDREILRGDLVDDLARLGGGQVGDVDV